MNEHVIKFYDSIDEDSRLAGTNSRKVEFFTTTKILDEHIGKGTKVLDLACGTGVYALHYANKGADVYAYDLTPKHIDILNDKLSKTTLSMKTGLNDATDLSIFKDKSFDVVLCMGPMYHIIDEQLRTKCITECNRVLKDGGVIAIAYINRLFLFPYVALIDNKLFNMTLAEKILTTGVIAHDDPDCFFPDSYYFSIDELENFVVTNGFDVIDHVATDGLSRIAREKIDKLSDENFSIWCAYHFKTCREKYILGTSNHGLVIGRKVYGNN